MAKKRKSKRMELVRQFRIAQAQANRKLKEMNKSGLRELSPQYSKKWDLYLSNPKYSTKTGMWKGNATKMNMKELNNMIAVLTTYNNNQYITPEYTRSYVDNAKEKWGIESDDTLKSMYRAAREYGYLTAHDSDIEAVSELAIWYNNNPKGDFNEWAEKFASQFEKEQQRQYDTNDLRSALIRHNQNPTEYPYGL